MLNQFLVITVVFFLFALSHSVLAVQSVQNALKAKMGALGKCYRFLYTLISILFLAIVLFFFPPGGEVLYRIQPPFSWVLRILQLVAGLFFLLALRDFSGQSFLGLDCLKKSAPLPEEKLNVTGLFQYCRHPMYLASTIFLLAQPQMTSGMLTYTLNIILYFLVGSIFEEKRLEKTFGAAYLEYKSKVPKFLPRLRTR